MEKIEKARQMAVAAHGEQKYGEHPYSVHLDDVAQLCAPFGEDAQVIAYLHDTLEDTDLSVASIADEFGGVVAGCVGLLTDPVLPNRKARKEASYALLASVDADSAMKLALVVKAADRLANVRASFRDRNMGLLSMYRKEHEAFKKAVLRAGLNDGLVSTVDQLLAS